MPNNRLSDIQEEQNVARLSHDDVVQQNAARLSHDEVEQQYASPLVLQTPQTKGWSTFSDISSRVKAENNHSSKSKKSIIW